MEKLMPILLSSCLILGITACRGTAENRPENTSASTEQSAAEAETRAPFTNIDAPGFAEKINAPNTVLLDVRTPAETADGIIEGALTIDFRDPEFKAKIEQLDKSKTYLVYCQSGGRSSRTCEMMAEMGFADLYNLEGGYGNWKEGGGK